MGRVGILAERKIKARSVTVTEPKIKKANIIQGQPLNDG